MNRTRPQPNEGPTRGPSMLGCIIILAALFLAAAIAVGVVGYLAVDTVNGLLAVMP